MTTITVKELIDVLSHFSESEKLTLQPDGKLITNDGGEVADFQIDEDGAKFYLATLLFPTLFEEEYNIDVMAMEGIYSFIEGHAEDIIAAAYERYSTTMLDYTKGIFLKMYANRYGKPSVETLAENIVIADTDAALNEYPTLLDARIGIAELLLA